MKKKHNLANKCKLYRIWKSIKYRCNNPKCKSYKNYGGRGIKVCEEWKNDFIPFYNWSMENGYREETLPNGLNKWTIDRIDNNGDYEPSNCRWVTNKEQSLNKRTSIPLENKNKICPICKKQFFTNNINKKTCSVECSRKLLSISQKNREDREVIFKECPICHKMFRVQKRKYDKRVHCSQECHNRSMSIILEYNGEKKTIKEWSKSTGLGERCIKGRVDRGWSVERILTTSKRGSEKDDNPS